MTEENTCRHEFVIMYQRRWKHSGPRLVSRHAYLPIGFKTTDLSYLGEEGYCFCAKCRVRLHPKLTRAEKTAAKLVRKAEQEAARAAEASREQAISAENESVQPVQVDELELEGAGIEVMEQPGLKITNQEEEEEEDEDNL